MKKLIQLLLLAGGVVVSLPLVAGGLDYQDQKETLSGLYLGGHLSAAFPTEETLNTGWLVGAELGYKFQHLYRIEAAFDYIGHSGRISGINYDLDVYTIMVNGYIDFNFRKFIPFIGVGVGYGNGTVSPSSLGGSGDSFAYQGIAGVGYQIRPHMVVSLAYRRLEFDSASFDENILQAGFDYYF